MSVRNRSAPPTFKDNMVIQVSEAFNPILRDLQNKAVEFATDTTKSDQEKLMFGFWLNSELETLWNKGVKNADVADFNAIVKILLDYIMPKYPDE